MDLTRMRQFIPISEQVIYLNTGSVGPSPEPALQAEADLSRTLAVQGPAAPFLWDHVRNVTDQARQALAAQLGAPPERIALTHHTSDGINIVAAGLDWRPGDEVVVSALEHASGLLPWWSAARRYGIKVVQAPISGSTLDPDAVFACFTPRTRVLCLSHVSYATGAQLPVARLCRLARERGILTVVDGAQAMGALDFDVNDLACDVYAFPGQKWLLGPQGTGGVYITESAQTQIHPPFVAWASVVPDGPLGPDFRFHPSAERYEVATFSPPLLAGLTASVRFLEQFDRAVIARRIAQATGHVKAELAKMPGVRVITPRAADASAGLITFTVDGVEPTQAVPSLWEQAKIVCRWVGTPNGRAMRFSVHAFNTDAELEGALVAVRRLAKSGI